MEALAIFPVRRQPNCLICVHALQGERTFCWMYQEPVLDERLDAEECPVYIEDPEAQ